MPAKPFFVNGHYHSPVVDPDEVRSHMTRIRNVSHADIKGINVSPDEMYKLWLRALPDIRRAIFPIGKPLDGRRFYLGGPFPFGDALFLRMIIGLNRPSRIVEVGSGFSTACMLDSADEFGLEKLRIICIEPEPVRLRALIKPSDYAKVEVIEKPIQEVGISIVEDLYPNDILFIDSSHVLKTGSDVHYEIAEMLPCLREGVLVHFHDCPFPFEYPERWVLESNYSWNEAYAVRLFLMFNKRFFVEFWGSLFRRIFAAELSQAFPLLRTENPGTSIWIRASH